MHDRTPYASRPNACLVVELVGAGGRAAVESMCPRRSMPVRNRTECAVLDDRNPTARRLDGVATAL
jgi:hypothetical protein